MKIFNKLYIWHIYYLLKMRRSICIAAWVKWRLKSSGLETESWKIKFGNWEGSSVARSERRGRWCWRWAWRTCRVSSTSFASASQLPPRLLPTTETTSFWRPDFALFFLISFTLMSSRLLQVFLPPYPISLPVGFRENLIRVKRKWDSDTLYLVCVFFFPS